MKPTHALAIAVALAVVAVFGVTAATKTLRLGASAGQASTSAIAGREHKLDAFEAALQKALKSRPPALPRVPVAHAVTSAPAAAASFVRASTRRVIYRRPAPIVVHKHRSHGDDGFESEGGGDD